MSIQFKCPDCGYEITVRFLGAGELAKCQSCGSRVPVPDPRAGEPVEGELMGETTSGPGRRSGAGKPGSHEDKPSQFGGPGNLIAGSILLLLGAGLLTLGWYSVIENVPSAITLGLAMLSIGKQIEHKYPNPPMLFFIVYGFIPAALVYFGWNHWRSYSGRVSIFV